MRRQAFEFMDLPQTPRYLRDSIVESLGNAIRWSGVYKNAATVFAEFCAGLQGVKLLELCSGSGEPATILLDTLNKQGKKLPCFLISDLFPVNSKMEKVVEQFPDNIEAINTPLDALSVPDSIPHSARVVISSLHHFTPDQARSILRDSAEKGKPIFILEPMNRRLMSVLKLGFFFFLSIMLNPIFSKRKRLLKVMFTYPIPLIPLMGIWDGGISVMRVYSEKELMALTSIIDADFQWKFHNIPVAWGGSISVFIGKPQDHQAEANR